MNYYPIKFDRKISGYDDNEIRLTNIVGHNGEDFLRDVLNVERINL